MLELRNNGQSDDREDRSIPDANGQGSHLKDGRHLIRAKLMFTFTHQQLSPSPQIGYRPSSSARVGREML